MSYLSTGNYAKKALGGVGSIYAVSLLLVAVTYILAIILGEDDLEFFKLSYTLMATEIFVPIMILINFGAFILNIIFPYILLPIFELVGWFLSQGMIFIFGARTTNPFAGVVDSWSDIDPAVYTDVLLEWFIEIKDFMLDMIA